MKTKPLTPAQRQKRHRETGKPVAVVITCPVALASLAALQAEHGGSVKLAMEAALRAAHGH